MQRLMILVAAAVLSLAAVAGAKTLMLEGGLNSRIAMRQQMEFSVDKGEVESFTFRFALPAEFHSRSVTQSLDSQKTDISPQPSSSSIEQDKFGNRFQKVVWDRLASNVRINLSYTVQVRSELSAMESRTPFPIGKVSENDAFYLQSTEMVQSESPEIVELARRLTADSKNEYEAVSVITNHVSDSIKYTFNPPKYDALYTLETRSGNCQNFAHLSIALLRSVGIPARIVGGITLKDSWKVPIDNRNTIVQSMGQGGHAWMEIYFPDLGWLQYDPQQSRQFTSSRHIKQSHGLDSRDINDTWRGTPYLPRYSEVIEGSFLSDSIKLAVKSTGKAPRSYIISNLVAARTTVSGTDAALESSGVERKKREQERIAREKAERDALERAEKERLAIERAERQRVEQERLRVERAEQERLKAERLAALKADQERRALEKSERDRLAKERKEAERVAKLKAEEERKARRDAENKRLAWEKAEADRIAKLEGERTPDKKPSKPVTGSEVLFGNMDFPNLVDGYSVQGNVGTRILDKETSEYVTSKYIFAQAFNLKNGMSLDKVSLAMRKFGGDGNVYVDLVRDDGGRPNILDGIRSQMVSLENISRKPGYYWVDFVFPADSGSRLKPGKYWIVLRSSGEAIMNWFYIPGKPYSESDDTRSTAKGFLWEDILTYDFVFKVAGKAL